MDLSIVFDTEYMGMALRANWFLKSVSHAKNNDSIIVTHEYIRNHLKEIVENCSDRFYTQFEMDRVSVEEILSMDICYIPDKLFDNNSEKLCSRSELITDYCTERKLELEQIIIEFVDKNLRKRNLSKPDVIYNCLHTFASVKFISNYYKCILVPYVFSAIRKVHGYTQTLYMANKSEDLFFSEYPKIVYKSFNETDLGFNLLSNEEILSLIGKKQNLFLIPLLFHEGLYEIGIACSGFCVTPSSYVKEISTDDDLYYEAEKNYKKSQIVSRIHPIDLDKKGIGRDHMRNDPVSFILSCKRIASLQSQLILKAALWNRVPCLLSKALPFSFLTQNDTVNNHRLPLLDLNFIIFCCLVPEKLMFDSSYWLWRSTNPSAKDIYLKNIFTILDSLKIDHNILKKKDRFIDLLKCRDVSERDIEKITSPIDFTVNYSFLMSSIIFVCSNGKNLIKYSVNRYKNDIFQTEFSIPQNVSSFKFIPQFDGDAYISLINVVVDDKELQCCTNFHYAKKNEPIKEIIVEKLDREQYLVIKWKAHTIYEVYSKNHSIIFDDSTN